MHGGLPQLFWDTAPASLRATLWMLLADLPPELPLLLFATADAPLAELDPVRPLSLNVGSSLGHTFSLNWGEKKKTDKR